MHRKPHEASPQSMGGNHSKLLAPILELNPKWDQGHQTYERSHIRFMTACANAQSLPLEDVYYGCLMPFMLISK